MEKILRKVKCVERSPEYLKNVFCLYHIGNSKTKNIPLYKKVFLYYDENNQWYDVASETIRDTPEYWYEEVDLDEIIAIEKQKCSTEYAERLKVVLEQVDTQVSKSAKERYKGDNEDEDME